MSTRKPRFTISRAYHELAMAAGQRSASAGRGEVTLTRNAKGDTQISVSVTIDGDRYVTVNDAAAEARTVYDQLRALYPFPAPEPDTLRAKLEESVDVVTARRRKRTDG